MVIGICSFALPLPIGRLSDYGNVLDRHGRERINSLIETTERRFGIEVYILASWEASDMDLEHYTYTLLDDWDLSEGRTLLAVFLKEAGQWGVALKAGGKTASGYTGLAQEVEEGLRDLVSHRRIEEAMVELFNIIERRLSASSMAPKHAESGKSRLPVVLPVIGSLILAALFVWRRICPRCGRILRVRRSRPFGPYGEIVVYYCRRCGYSRIKKTRGEG